MIFHLIPNDSRRVRFAQHEIICNIYHWFGLLFARSFALTRSVWSTFHRKINESLWQATKMPVDAIKRYEEMKKTRKQIEDGADAHISANAAVPTISCGCESALFLFVLSH